MEVVAALDAILEIVLDNLNILGLT